MAGGGIAVLFVISEFEEDRAPGKPAHTHSGKHFNNCSFTRLSKRIEARAAHALASHSAVAKIQVNRTSVAEQQSAPLVAPL